MLTARLLSASAREASVRLADLLGMRPEGVRAQLIGPSDANALRAELRELCKPSSGTADGHDVRFRRSRAAAVERELGEVQRVAEELGGIRAVPVTVPTWLRPTGGPKRAAVVGAHTSDLHNGERIRAEEISGINAYDPSICAARMQRYFGAVAEIGNRWAADAECRGVLLTMGGDLISGNIHDELRETNALTAHEQVRATVEIYCAGIGLLLEAYPAVHVLAVPGNHGRTTLKPSAKRYAALSYDILIASMVADRFRGDARVTFQIADGADVIASVLGRQVLVTHGDKIGTAGGMGFAGPLLPILRGTAKVRAQRASVDRPPDLMLTAHYHVSANLPGVLANGSVVGYSEYGSAGRFAVEPPKQWLFLIRERWGLCERLDVQLEGIGKTAKAEPVFGAL